MKTKNKKSLFFALDPRHAHAVLTLRRNQWSNAKVVTFSNKCTGLKSSYCALLTLQRYSSRLSWLIKSRTVLRLLTSMTHLIAVTLKGFIVFHPRCLLQHTPNWAWVWLILLSENSPGTLEVYWYRRHRFRARPRNFEKACSGRSARYKPERVLIRRVLPQQASSLMLKKGLPAYIFSSVSCAVH